MAGSKYNNETRCKGHKVKKLLHVFGVRFTECDVRRNGTAISSAQTARYLCQITGCTNQNSSLQSAARPVRSAVIETEHHALLDAFISASNVTIFDLITLVTFCAMWRRWLLPVT
jgi:hypothetical protein